MKDGRKRRSAAELATELFDLPAEALAGMPRIMITGNRRIHIDCHRGILEYSDSLITVNGGAVVIEISGEQLEIVSMSADELLICGSVSRFEFK